MKKEELIALIEKNFSDGEEVKFLYYDDGSDTIGKSVKFKIFKREAFKTKIEVFEDGKWIEWTKECHPSNDFDYCEKHNHPFQMRGGYAVDRSWWRETTIPLGIEIHRCLEID